MGHIEWTDVTLMRSTTNERASWYPCSRTIIKGNVILQLSGGKDVRWKIYIPFNLPTNRQQFLRIDANKVQLFTFLKKHITHMATIKRKSSV